MKTTDASARRTQRRRGLRGAVVAVASGAVLTAGLLGYPAHGPVSAPSAVAADNDADPTAWSEDAAQHAAALRGKRVEALNLRTEQSETYAQPDGTFTTVQHVQPVRTWQGGEWADIDTTLVQRKDGSWAPRAATVGLAISGGGDGPFVTMREAGKTLSVDWPGTLPEPRVEGDTATYPEVLPGVDLVVRADMDGYSHLLVVKSALAAANPRLAEIELPVTTDGVRLKDQPGGGVVAEDTGSGGPVFEAPEPVMWDSSRIAAPAAKAGVSKAAPATSGDRVQGPEDLRDGPGEGSKVSAVGLETHGDRFVLTPSASALKSATYPLYIDPITKTYTRSGWTMVSSYWSSQEFWKFSGDEGVGRCPADVSSLCSSSDDRKRQFYAVPTSSLAGKDIVKAEFAITLTSAYNSTARGVILSRVNSSGSSAISSSTNWTNQPTSKEHVDTASTTARAGSCSSTNQNLRFTATSTVQRAADSSWATTTFRLLSDDESSYAYWNRFCGNGQLEVTYNRPPATPKQSEMSINPGGACVHGTSRPYTDSLPSMKAVIRDYDHNDVSGASETLKAQFQVSWTPPGGSLVTKSFTTNTLTSRSDPNDSQLGIATFSAKVGTSGTVSAPVTYTVPENVVVSWQVRGSDGTAWGPWSAAAPNACEFVYDRTKPAAPVVASTTYPDDDDAHAGVGDYGTFTFTSTSTDVVSYRYQFTGEAQLTAAAATGTGRPATIRWVPLHSGPYTLTVTAVDAAGKSQATPGGYQFMVAQGRTPAAVWKLDDAAGSTKAAGRPGDPDAVAGSGVTFHNDGIGDQKSRVAVTLDGTAGGYLATSTPVVATDKSFSLAAWAYLPALPSQDMTVLSQDGTGGPGFSLGYDGATKKWVFRSPVAPLDSLGDWRVLDSTPAVAGIWTHLAGVYDGDLNTMRLYKQGVQVGTTAVSRPTPWGATGGLQIGRALALSGYTEAFMGSVSEVQLYDRLISPEEMDAIQGVPPEEVAVWQLDEAIDGVSPEAAGGSGMTLGSGASIYQVDDSCDPGMDPDCVPAEPALSGDGHLSLNGSSTSYATADAGLLVPQGSFAVAAQARMATPLPGGDETVLGLSGPNSTAVLVRYVAAQQRWQLVATDKDTSPTQVVSAEHGTSAPTTNGRGDHLTLAYDAVTGVVTLFVNGEFGGAQALWPNAWDFSAVGVQVGRTLTGSTGSAFFSGALDEVRVYQGVVDARRAAEINAASSGKD